MEIPTSLKENKTISPYISRSLELESINPVVSYYCKIYILEYILSNKLHTTGKDVESYTIALLDETEQIKLSTEDEGLNKALNDKTISLTLVMEFTFKLFNSCLQDLSNYDGTNKFQLVGKFKACLNFMNLLSIFYNKPDASINWEKFKVNNNEEFSKSIKEKLKILKFNLTQLIKDEVKITQDDKELEDELERELRDIEKNNIGGEENEFESDLPSAPKFVDEPELPSAPKFVNDPELPSAPTFNDVPELPSAPNFDSEPELPSPKYVDEPKLPSAPKFVDEPFAPSAVSKSSVSLPGAPHFLPQDSPDSSVKLPGAPKFLPDDDISHINKDSSIKVFPPKGTNEVPSRRVSSVSKNIEHAQVKPQDINEIINKTEVISKIQKHAKFAISALNYEDIGTAEKELKEALEMIQNLK